MLRDTLTFPVGVVPNLLPMRLVASFPAAALILLTAFSSASGQAGAGVRKAEQDESTAGPTDVTAAPAAKTGQATTPAAQPDEQRVWIYLVGGRRLEVDEATEGADGVWYRRGNVTTLLDRGRVERIERNVTAELKASSESFRGSGKWHLSDSAKVEGFFAAKFNRPLPVTAFGQSDLHTRWGFDHRHALDIGLHPNSPEGRALIKFLRDEGIPFLSFRSAVPGVATGPHIHIGEPSQRLSGR